MTSYSSNIPLATNNPSTDQPNMKTNTNSIATVIAVDHVPFNLGTSGQHAQVTFNANQSSPTIQAGAVAVETVNSGVASGASQLFFKNSNANFHLSPIAAWGAFASGATTTTQGFNISSVSKSGPGVYIVTLATGAVNSANFAVLVSVQRTAGVQLIIDYETLGFSGGQGAFTIAITNDSSALQDAAWSFAVLQI